MPVTRAASPAGRSAEPPEAGYSKLSPGPGRKASEVAAHQRTRIHGAMIDLSAGRGYRSVTVRALTKRAGVSTRAFYTHFEDKESCFLSAYEKIVRRMAKKIVFAQAGEADWRERLRLAFGAFVQELERDPRAARSALIEIYAVGPGAIPHIHRTESMFEAMLVESFSRSPSSVPMPPCLARGILAGTLRVAKAGVSDPSSELSGLGDELTDWALCYYSDVITLLPELESRASYGQLVVEAHSSSGAPDSARPLDGERALILSAITRLVSDRGYDKLAVSDICAAAGVSRKVFDTYFESVEDCFIAAIRRETSRVLGKMMPSDRVRASENRVNPEYWAKGIHQVVLDFCAQLGTSSNFAKLCLGGLSTSGTSAVRCGERLLEQVEDSLFALARSPVELDDLRLKASAGAAWGALCHQLVLSSRPGPQASLVAGSLSFLALAPLVGPKTATTAIRDVTLRAKLQETHDA